MHRLDSENQEVASIAILTAVCLRGGLSIIHSLAVAVERADSKIAKVLQDMIHLCDLGLPLRRAIDEVLKVSQSAPLNEFLVKLQLASLTGSNLADQLDELVLSLNEHLAVIQLRRAAKRETAMMYPLVFLILPVTVLFALYPSLQILNVQML